MSTSTKYNKEQLEEAVKESISYAGVMKKLGKKWSGGQQQNLKKWIKEWEIDTSHFLGQAATRGTVSPKRKAWQAVLVLTEDRFFREKACVLRAALIESGVDYICNECGRKPIWRKKPLTLQVNHKNGDWRDNRRDNLEFLCPNCHAITEGWSGKQVGVA